MPEPRSVRNGAWRRTVVRDLFTCPDCGYLVDTPQHYYGCQRRERRQEQERSEEVEPRLHETLGGPHPEGDKGAGVKSDERPPPSPLHPRLAEALNRFKSL